jgi:hypothetical protein
MMRVLTWQTDALARGLSTVLQLPEHSAQHADNGPLKGLAANLTTVKKVVAHLVDQFVKVGGEHEAGPFAWGTRWRWRTF